MIRQAGYEGDYCLLHEAAREERDEGLLEQRRKAGSSTDILYGIFTSGSTGTPKGIVVSHKAVIDFITHFTEIFGINEEDRIGNQAPFDFDVSVKDIYSAVMTGAALVLIPRQMFSVPAALLDYLCEKKTTVLIWAVSALTMISALGGLKYRIPSDVRKVMFSGEVMPGGQLALWQQALPGAEFVNLYGPTEITCNCTYFSVKKICGEEEKLPIGKAFPGRKVFLLTEEAGRSGGRSRPVRSVCRESLFPLDTIVIRKRPGRASGKGSLLKGKQSGTIGPVIWAFWERTGNFTSQGERIFRLNLTDTGSNWRKLKEFWTRYRELKKAAA